jgi:hypothetical protein
MSANNVQMPPCAGKFEGLGCDPFEGYFKEARIFIATHPGDDRHDLLSDPVALRQRLHEEFAGVANHCVLNRVLNEQEANSRLPPGVSSLVRKSDIKFAGCRPAEKARDEYDRHRLLTQEQMADLIADPRPLERRPDADVAVLYETRDAVFQERVLRHQMVMQNDDLEISDRIISGGALLFYFYDVDSVDQVEELFKKRVNEIGRDDLGSEEWSSSEWESWLQVMVGVELFSRIDDETFSKAIEMLLINGFDSSVEHVKIVGKQAYKHLTVLMADEVIKRSSDRTEDMLMAIDQVSTRIVELIALRYRLDKDALVRVFSGTEETELEAGQVKLRLV